MTKEMIWPLIKAAMPFLLAALAAAGVHISPDLQNLLLNNLDALLLAIGGLGLLTPSVKAAVKYEEKAD